MKKMFKMFTCELERTKTFCFYYQETGTKVGGQLSRNNIPFTIEIQTPWQATMMQQYGHQNVVAIDATFWNK